MSTPIEWRRIPNASRYEVSDTGLVRSWCKPGPPRVLAQVPHGRNRNYRAVTIAFDGPEATRPRLVHLLVLLAFVGPRPEGMLTRHLNGDGADNRLANLTYGTPEQNKRDSLRLGENHNANKTHCKRGHEFTPDNTYLGVAKNGGPVRRCRTCGITRATEWNRKNRARLLTIAEPVREAS